MVYLYLNAPCNKFMKKKIYLIRHGKTYCNEKQLYCGKTDIDLSECGINELKLKDINQYPKCDFYFTSGLKRANSTLKIICPEINYTVIKEFSEYDFGDFELKSYEDLKNIKEYQEWIADETENVHCPNGESRFEFRNRIENAFDKLIEYMVIENKETCLGVIHGGAIGTILEIKYDDSKKFYEWQPKNGYGYEIIVDVLDNKHYKICSIKPID